MNDHVDEEMEIASEQDSSGTALSASTFRKPISDVSMPKVIALDAKTSSEINAIETHGICSDH